MIDIWTNARSHSDKRNIYVLAIWSKVMFTQMCHLSICYIFITVLMNSKLSYFSHIPELLTHLCESHPFFSYVLQYCTNVWQANYVSQDFELINS